MCILGRIVHGLLVLGALILEVRHDVVVFKVIEVQVLQVLSEFLVFLLEFVEEFLSVRSGLSGSPGSNMLLDLLPLLAEVLEGLQESEMLILGPPAHLKLTIILLLVLASHIRRGPRDLNTLSSLYHILRLKLEHFILLKYLGIKT